MGRGGRVTKDKGGDGDKTESRVDNEEEVREKGEVGRGRKR